jgi:nitrite reductase/ring-hydroxylating ferredoxin subunit
LLVRTAPDEIKAYRNACLHRGRKLRETHGRGAINLRCAFHGWCWNNDGSLKEIPCEWDFPDIDTADYDLPEAKVDTWQGFVYLATVIDCYSRKVVGWSVADHMRTKLVVDALKNAAQTTVIEAGAVFHSDRGSVYVATKYRTLVTRLGMRSSVGKTGVCWDNALAESFFSALKNERVHRTVYATKAQATRDVIMYIEGFYNNRRRHSALGYRRPNDVHYAYQQQALAA